MSKRREDPHKERQMPGQGAVLLTLLAVKCHSPNGFKSRAARLAEHGGGSWVHRAGGYGMSPRKADRLMELFLVGRDACSFTGGLLGRDEGT